MKKTSISVTEAARNFADCVNRVRYQDLSYVLLKNGSPVAQLVPHKEKVCRGRDLAEALGGIKLSRDEVRSWRRDLRNARKFLKPPVNRWK
jgi:prevent-host-death family protein